MPYEHCAPNVAHISIQPDRAIWREYTQGSLRQRIPSALDAPGRINLTKLRAPTMLWHTCGDFLAAYVPLDPDDTSSHGYARQVETSSGLLVDSPSGVKGAVLVKACRTLESVHAQLVSAGMPDAPPPTGYCFSCDRKTALHDDAQRGPLVWLLGNDYCSPGKFAFPLYGVRLELSGPFALVFSAAVPHASWTLTAITEQQQPQAYRLHVSLYRGE